MKIGFRAVVVALALGGASAANAQMGMVTAAFGAKKVNDVIDHAQDAANHVLDNANVVGNGLLTQAANELSTFALDAQLRVGNEADRQVSALDATGRELMKRLDAQTTKVQGMLDDVYDMKDTLVVDVASLEAGIPFTRVPSFFLQKIKPVAFMQRPGDYDVTIIGHGMTTNSSETTTVSLRLGGVDVPVTFDSDAASKVIVHIPEEAMKPYYNKDKLAVAPAKFTFTTVHHHWLWPDSTDVNTVPIRLSIYPKFAASAQVTWTKPQYQWVGIEPLVSTTLRTGSHDGCKQDSCAWYGTQSVSTAYVTDTHTGRPLLGARRVVPGTEKIYYHQNNNFCAFLTVVTRDDHGHKVNDCTATPSSYQCSVRDNSAPVDFHMTVAQEELRSAPATQGADSIRLDFDQHAALNIPNDASQIVLKVTTYTKRVYDWPIDTNDPQGLVSLVNHARFDDSNDRYLFTTVRPVVVGAN
jgi:hypothetical protein